MTRFAHRRAIITGGGRDPDQPPELLDYQDTGCRLWSACLSCPFPECFYGLPAGARQALSQFRAPLMRSLYDADVPLAEIAARFAVTERTVYRAIGGIRPARAARKGAA